MTAANNNTRCTSLLKRYGYGYVNVEKYNAHLKITRDFPYTKGGGFADYLAWHSIGIRETLAELEHFTFRGVLAIQVCSQAQLWDHFYKVVHGSPYPHLRDWLLSDNRFEIWAFPARSRKHKSKKGTSQLIVQFLRLTYEDEMYYAEETELTALGYII